MRLKHRNVGDQNPFHTKNAPPKEYTVPDIITANPCKITHVGVDSRLIPYSGKLGTLGKKILEDYKKAAQVTSFDWNEEQFKDYGKVNPRKKPAKDITSKLTLDNFEKTGFVDY